MEKKSLKILVMDDERSIWEVLGAMLEHLGHRVELTERGEEALEKYSSAQNSGETFDLVILDLIIPNGMGGVETLKKLKEINPDVISIISSGYSGRTPKGFSVFLPKSYRMEDLKKALEEALEKK